MSKVPRWEGELERFAAYLFDVKMCIKPVKKPKRHTCAPSLVLAMSGKAEAETEVHDILGSIGKGYENGERVGAKEILIYTRRHSI